MLFGLTVVFGGLGLQIDTVTILGQMGAERARPHLL